jgi:uncharacterized protein (DUF433 family)
MSDIGHDLRKGIYSVSQAARLTGVPQRRIRRWIRGYSFGKNTDQREMPPVWHGQWDPIDHELALGFLDLIELRFVDAFVQHGVSWKELRLAHEGASARVGSEHPFCTGRFCTDGRRILEDLAKAAPALRHQHSGFRDVVRNQQYFDRIMRPIIVQLEFRRQVELVRWWPLGKRRQVVLDPCRQFGHPIVVEEGVATRTLAASLKANNAAKVAEWFGVSPRAVRDAAAFEASRAA